MRTPTAPLASPPLARRSDEGRWCGPVRVFAREGRAGTLVRPPEPPPAPALCVAVQPAGGAVLTHGGRRSVLAPGDVVVLAAARPWTLRQPHDFRLDLLLVPYAVIGATDTELAAVQGAHGTGTGVAGLLPPLLAGVAAAAGDCPPQVGRALAGGVADLLALLAAERGAAPASAPGERADMARRIRQYVNDHLQDPALGPESIAAHHRVSVRYLHKAFSAQGTTLSRWIRRRRLEECRRELARADTTVSFAAVARRWGFTNAAHFSRSFRAAYGVSPGEWSRIRAADQSG
ncbi:helix-turn-helix domain-containing protein [Streptomyces sp. NPDC048290]|uniref:helix-turn-helix domain-containing protein n=1 Tax=Streptomyces sp. NPDC048290 TaxID=3155811 RepID=UPI0034287D13